MEFDGEALNGEGMLNQNPGWRRNFHVFTFFANVDGSKGGNLATTSQTNKQEDNEDGQ
jgi:hypothetical protein